MRTYCRLAEMELLALLGLSRLTFSPMFEAVSGALLPDTRAKHNRGLCVFAPEYPMIHAFLSLQCVHIGHLGGTPCMIEESSPLYV